MIRKTLGGVRPHVWSDDPALDKHDPDAFAVAWKAFLDGGEVDKLPLNDGQRPCVFEYAPLTRRQFLRVIGNGGTILEQATEAIAYGLRSVKGFEVDGRPIDVKKAPTDLGDRIAHDTLDALFDPVLFAELGARIIEATRIPPPSGQGS